MLPFGGKLFLRRFSFLENFVELSRNETRPLEGP